MGSTVRRGERCDCGWSRSWSCWWCWLASSPAQAFETAAKAAIIIDNRTGAVLFEKNADERIPPASMSKLMTAYMIFDQLKSGKLKLDEEILVSERAWKMGGSQMFVEVGERVKVEDLIRGIIIQSGNDACVTMAEAIAGSEEEFARADDREGHGDRPDRQHLRQLDRPRRARAPDDRARPGPAGAPDHHGLPRATSNTTASASSSMPASSSPTATRCCRRACPASTA